MQKTARHPKKRPTQCKRNETPKKTRDIFARGVPQRGVDVELSEIIFNIFWLGWKKYFVYLVKYLVWHYLR